jgi:hypothetical protein
MNLESLKELEGEECKRSVIRAEFLKDKSPIEVLYWIMRAGDVPLDIRTQVAIALLPYAKDGIADE